jgi:hypothetical protein
MSDFQRHFKVENHLGAKLCLSGYAENGEFIVTKNVLLFLSAALLLCGAVWGQDTPGFLEHESLGVSSSYAPTSTHILIGIAQQRRTWTGGMEYTRRIWTAKRIQVDYKGEFSPFFRESDPAVVGDEIFDQGKTIVDHYSPIRVIKISHKADGLFCPQTSPCVPGYPVYGREATYAMSVSPIGARLVFLPRHRFQPTFGMDIGGVLSSRDIPVDSSAHFNYQFSFGPGVQVFISRDTAVRLEYVFRHISNANSGTLNPGIDQGVFRLSLSRYR